jgi:general stress protein YciG
LRKNSLQGFFGGDVFLSEGKNKGRMTVEEAGRMGGEKTAETHGPEFYSEIGSKGGSQRAKQHEGTPEAKGKTSLEEAGHLGGQKVRRLIQAGKEHEEE